MTAQPGPAAYAPISSAATPAQPVVGRRGKLTKLSTVRARPITWLLPGRIPFGAVTLLGGRPGKGKSQLSMAIGAAVTRGGNAFITVGAEDGLEDTVVPRIMAADGNTDLAHAFTIETASDDGDDIALLPEDIPALTRAVKDVGATFVVVDPLAAHLSPDMNTNGDHAIRQALRPLARMAQTTGAAVLVVTHFKKSREGSPLDWIGGSVGVGGSVRSALLLGESAKETEERQETWRYLCHVKANGAKLAPAMVWQIEDQLVEVDGRTIRTSSINYREDTYNFQPQDLA